jgi:hypothetical protein
MSESKHTPGPWTVTLGGPRGSFHISEAKSHDEAEHSDDGVDGYTVSSANARLIAAAPDLLQKLQKVVAWLDRLATRAEKDAKDTRFVSLSEANAADAKNYRATIADISAAIAKATGSEGEER